MSDTNKPRQPSPKHTLEDILRSLQDLLHNELAETPVPAKNPPLEKPETASTSHHPIPAHVRLKQVDAPPLEETAPALASTLEQMSIEWEDLPVLTEVVAAAGAEEEQEAARAQRLAVLVIDRLNAELRSLGQTPLAPAIIERLARILREALRAELEPRGPAK